MRIRRAAAALVLATLPAAPARADEFDDFRIPPHRALLWNGSVNVGGSRSHRANNISEDEDGNLQGQLATNGFWYYDSDPSYTELGASGFFGGTRDRSTRHQAFATPAPSTSLMDAIDAQRRLTEGFSVFAAHRRYPWAVPIGGSLSASGGASYAQSWRNGELEAEQRTPFSSIGQLRITSEERWNYATFFNGAAAVDFGRVRDATAVYEVMVLEDRLREAGVVRRALSPAARERLVAITYERFAMLEVRERPARTLWDAIERVLRDDGALGDEGLDGHAIFRAVEPYLGPSTTVDATGLPRSPVQRLRGARIGPTFLYQQAHIVSRIDASLFDQQTIDGLAQPPFEDSVHQRFDEHFDRPLGGVQASYHRPFGPQWQLDFTGDLLLPASEDELMLMSVERASMTFLVADRWQADARINHQWIDETRTTGATPGDRWSWNYGVTVRYYLEDHTSLELSANENQAWVRGEPGNVLPTTGPLHQYVRAGGVSLGLVYRFAGSFDAPAFPGP